MVQPQSRLQTSHSERCGLVAKAVSPFAYPPPARVPSPPDARAGEAERWSTRRTTFVVDWPPIRLVRFSGEALVFGVEATELEGVVVKITSRERTVADCLKYRNKIGLDVALEALREYLRSKKRSVDDLVRAARVCRVSRVMQP